MRYSFRLLGIAAVFAASVALAQGTITISPIAQMASACDAGTGSACYELGEKLYFGNDVGKDEPRARRLHDRGCSLNEARSCFRLGTLTVRGGDWGPPVMAGARAAYEKSCSLNNSNGCSAVGSVYAIGAGVPIDMTRAAIAYQQACRLEPSSDYICTKARETVSYLPASQAQAQGQAERPLGAPRSSSAPSVSSAAATERPDAPAASTTPSPALRLISGRNAFEITSSDPVVGTLRVKYLEFQAEAMTGVNFVASNVTPNSNEEPALILQRRIYTGGWITYLPQTLPTGLIGTLNQAGPYRLAVSLPNRATGQVLLTARNTEPSRHIPTLANEQVGYITSASATVGASASQSYSISVRRGQTYWFRAQTDTLRVRLVASMGGRLLRRSGELQLSPQLNAVVMPTDGTLLISVEAQAGQTGVYDLRASTQPFPNLGLSSPPVSATSSAPSPPAQSAAAQNTAVPTPNATPNAGQSLDQRARSLRADQPVEARRRYEQSCTGGSAAGCFGLGWMLHNSRGGAGDRPRALGLIERACSGNIGEACDYLGYIHEYGSGIAKDETKARGHYQKSCALSFSEGCLNIALLQLDGRGGVKDERAARSNLEQSCRLGDRVGCSTLASVRTSGKGGAVDLAGAATAKRRSCELGLTSECTN